MGIAQNMTPADGAVVEQNFAALDWSTGPGEVQYDIYFGTCLAEAAKDIGPKPTYSSAACRVAMGTYPASRPGGGVTIKAGSISASFPIVGGGT